MRLAWEYKWINNVKDKQIEEIANKNALEGWRLMQIEGIIYNGTTMGRNMLFEKEIRI